jgi:hypothetical protein
MGGVQVVQSKLGVAPTNRWDAATLSALAPFQATGSGPLAMYPTGEPDPATLINAGYYDPLQVLPRSWSEYATGGPAPGTFWRDLRVSSNQVPQWIWLALGIVLVSVGYYTYRRRARRSS